jgi:hypothetical protein
VKALRLAASCAIGTGLLLFAAFAPKKRPVTSSEYPTRTVREEQTIIIGGLTEVWQLKWTTEPKPVCEPDDVSLTCPCTGFAYGEGGDLNLVRMRKRVEVDRLHITPAFDEQLFGEGPMAVIQRWQADYEKDFEASNQQDFPAIVSKRPSIQVMHLADYDHDGLTSEFYLQTGVAPCGKSGGVIIGVSKRNPQLHVFGTSSKPDKPLYLQKREWEALRDASGPIEVLDWSCGDHGADARTTLQLRWTPGGIDGTCREFACTPDDKPGRLIHEEPL